VGSADVEHLATDDRIHVARDRKGTWWATGRYSVRFADGSGSCGRSFGGSRSRSKAIAIAIDAAVTLNRHVVIHGSDDVVQYVLTRFKRHAPSSQFFQDDVP
jgi:hypothetical protein